MSLRIVVPCSETTPRRHRWFWRDTHYLAPGGFVQDQRCTHCGIWKTDAIEHKPEKNPKPYTGHFELVGEPAPIPEPR